jgi:hypothetical protein
MCFKSVVKRVAPFLLTFSIGLLIASFFVTVAAPNFQFRRSGFKRHREYDREREARIGDLERENNCLKKRLAEMERQRDWVLDEVEPASVPAPPLPPAPPTMSMKSVPSRTR